MNEEPRNPNVPDWLLERYRLGELPAAERDAVTAAIGTDERMKRRCAALEQSDREILMHYSPRRMSAAIRARLDAAGPVRRSAFPLLRPAHALAMVLLLIVAGFVLRPTRPGTEVPADEIRLKGLSPSLQLYRQRHSAGPELLEPGSIASQGDIVQIVYQAAGRRYGTIFSVDGRGLVTRHLPITGDQAVPLRSGWKMPLSDAYQLDDAPGFERFYLVSADEPFPVESVVEAVQRDDPAPGAVSGSPRLDLPVSFDQFSFLLKKDSTP